MKVIKGISLLMGLLASLWLSGCRKPEMLDGPGMVYEPPWIAFSLTSSGSSARHQFRFTVEEKEDVSWLTGVCRDEDGIYENQEGIALSVEDLWKLRWLDLHTLEDASELPEDPEHVLDGSKVTLTLTLPNGQVVAKNASLMLSLEIYEILLPYFKNVK